MEFFVLGPLEVRSTGGRIGVGGVKQRSILALLIANRGCVVSTDRIVVDIYGEDAAGGVRRSVQSIVSLLRRDLGDVIIGSGDGYLFDAPRDGVDVNRFEDGVAEGLDMLGDDPGRASVLLRDVLGLWRGDPYGDVDGRVVFEAEITRLVELRFVALEARIEADLACGRHRELVGELEALTMEYPLREGLWALLMLALYRAGRQGDALGVYQRLRTVLAEDLGIEPSTKLRMLEEQILFQDSALEPVALVPHNLPGQLTSFVGRRLELIDAGERLAESRLITLVGAGGSGKTRMAVELAREVLDDHPDGVWFVDLRRISDPVGVVSLVASTLGVVTAGDRRLVDQLADALWSRRLLVVLDNCEHVVDGVAPLVERLMHREGQVRVLATSREPLGVPGESMMLVEPLPVPESAALDDLERCEAAMLFSDRARSVMPGFALGEHVESVFRICVNVEGLPLALELAAARLRIFSPEEVAGRLDDQLTLLKTTQRTGDLRHATIEATIQWSWELLDDAEQTLLGRLSVFRGTWTLAAAESICGIEPLDRTWLPDLMGSLVDKSLVVVDGVSGGSTRYRLLEPIRQYTARHIGEQATGRLRSRCVDYWAVTLTGSHDEPWIARRDFRQARALEPDRANLTAAIDWALASGRLEDASVIFASPLGDLLMLQGSGFELASVWIDRALENPDTISPEILVCALRIACSISSTAFRNDAWRDYAELGIKVSQTSKERQWFEMGAAVATNRQGQHDEARKMLRRLFAEADNPGMRASALLAETQYESPERAWALVQRAMDLSPIDSLGWWGEDVAAWLIGRTAANSGRYGVAIEMAERSLELSRRWGWCVVEGTAAALLARVYTAMGRLDEAAALIAEAVPVVRRILGPNITSLTVLLGAADIARLQGNLEKARSYVDEAQRAAERVDIEALGKSQTIYQSALIARDDHDQVHAGNLLGRMVESLEVSGEEHDAVSPSRVRIARASVGLRIGDPDRALDDLRNVLAEPHRLQHLDAVEAVDQTAIAFAQQGRAELAARLKGAVDREREKSGLVVQPPDAPLRASVMRHAQNVFDGDWEEALQHGRMLTLEEAVAIAADETNPGRERRPDIRHTSTPTEAAGTDPAALW